MYHRYLTAMVIKLFEDFVEECDIEPTAEVMGFWRTFDFSLMLFIFYTFVVFAVVCTIVVQVLPSARLPL